MAHKNDNLENVLLSIIASHALSEQSQIQEKLHDNGIDIPQSTLSRWLKKLNIVKVNHLYQIGNQTALARIPIFSIKIALPNLMVLHTLPGNANSLAYQIDQKIPKPKSTPQALKNNPYAKILGTIAGDDTVLVIAEDQEGIISFKTRLEQNSEPFFILLNYD